MPRVGAGSGEKLTRRGVRVLWQQQQGLVWMSKAIDSPAAHTVEERAKEAETWWCWWVQACHPHSRCFEC